MDFVSIRIITGDVARLVDDVDGVHEDLSGFVDEFVSGPTTMPWGNRSLLLRDPDGNLVNFFTPVTPAAVAKFAS
ncbi:VOC family protein [Streptomyces lavendulae]